MSNIRIVIKSMSLLFVDDTTSSLHEKTLSIQYALHIFHISSQPSPSHTWKKKMRTGNVIKWMPSSSSTFLLLFIELEIKQEEWHRSNKTIIEVLSTRCDTWKLWNINLIPSSITSYNERRKRSAMLSIFCAHFPPLSLDWYEFECYSRGEACSIRSSSTWIAWIMYKILLSILHFLLHIILNSCRLK